MTIVRSINKELGGTTRSRLKTFGESAIKGLTLPTVFDANEVGDLKKESINTPVDSEMSATLPEDMSVTSRFRLGLSVLSLRFNVWIMDTCLSLVWWWYGLTERKPKQMG